MAILQLPTPIPGTQGTLPEFKFMASSDDLGVIVTPGYLNQVDLTGISISPTDVIQVLYDYNQQLGTGNYVACTVSISNGIIKLNAEPGSAIIPTKPGHLAVYLDTNGLLTEDYPTAINGGNIQAGLSGTRGSLIAFPSEENSGSFIFYANQNPGNFLAYLTTASVGQNTTYTLPDPSSGFATVAVSVNAISNGNIPVGTSLPGVLIDSGTSVANLAPRSAFIAGQTQNIGAGGAGPINFAVPGLTDDYIVVGCMATSTNPVSIIEFENGVAFSGNISVTFSADPGAAAYVNYMAYLP